MVVRSDCINVLMMFVLMRCFEGKMLVLIYLRHEILE